MPPMSGEVETPVVVVVCSRRVRLEGEGTALLATDVAELLMAVEEERRVALVIDVHGPIVDLPFFARLARDFPPRVAMLVSGRPQEAARCFHDRGVYRPAFDESDEGVLADDGRAESLVIARAVLEERVRQRLRSVPDPLASVM
jgi:hypothetical protein